MATKTKNKSTFSIEDAVVLVKGKETVNRGRYDRQDLDYNQWRREPYNTNMFEGNLMGAEFKSFTGNEAKAYAKKVVSMLSNAEVLIQVPYGRAQEGMRKLYDIKERFAYGVLEMANDALAEQWHEPSIHDQFSWHSPHRGFIVLKHLFLNNDETGESEVEIRIWDSRNSTWQEGRGGLRWACKKTVRTVSDINAEYGDVITDKDDDDELAVYDFYTREKNAIFTEDVFLKDWTEHGSRKVPISVVPVPFAPPLWSDTIKDINADYGESIFAENRGLFDQINEVMSITLELLSKAREPAAIAFTDEEDTEFEEDPQTKGDVSYMGKDDKFQQLLPPTTSKDAIQFMSMLTGMVQRGGLPYSSYGELQFAISGYAITQLNQQIMTVLAPQVKAMAQAYRMCITALLDQFVGGKFHNFDLRGFMKNRDYTQMEMSPGLLQGLPPYKVQVVAELPQDDVALLAAVQQARSGPNPLLPDRYLLDEYLHVPDANLVVRMLKEQAAETASPRAGAMQLAKASADAGNMEMAKVYLDELELATLQLGMEKISLLAQAQQFGIDPSAAFSGAQGIPSQPGQPGSGPPGVSSGTSPGIAQSGVPNAGATPTTPQGAGRPAGAARQQPQSSAVGTTSRAQAPIL